MRIVQLGKYYPPYRGGIESVVETTCNALVRRGLTVTVVVSNDGPETVDEIRAGARVIRVGRQFELRSQPINLGLPAALASLDYDLLHVHTPNPIYAVAAVHAAGDRPIVVSHHSDVIRQRVLGVAARAAHNLLYSHARAIVAATPRHIQFSKLLNRHRARCRVIPFPIELDDVAPEGTWDEALPQSWEHAPLALFVGRLVYYKGVDVLLRAVAGCPLVNLALVGNGPLRAELEASAARLGVSPRVRFLGEVSEARLRELYACARFLVLPSTAASEAFGMVQLEAMRAGRPVISTLLPSGVPFVNQHQRTGLIVPPGEAAPLAAAMHRLATDMAYADRLGQGARKRVCSDFSVERVVDRWLELYAELARSS
jgi:glycosyltransferase involved in cell wall biosynthesis